MDGDNTMAPLLRVLQLLLIIVVAKTFITTHAFAQVEPTNTTWDTLKLPPGTVLVNATVKSVDKNMTQLEILSVIAESQGIISPPSVGQIIILPTAARQPLTAGKKIEAVMKEKMQVDASQSSYTLLSYKIIH
jgi:hypothetical protein